MALTHEGFVQVQNVPTFRRWDGAWLDIAQMDLGADNWPYRLRDSGTTLTAETKEGRFSQGKVPGARYEFLPEGIKETIELAPMTALVAYGDGKSLGVIVPFSTDLNASVDGVSVLLKDATGAVVWRTEPFLAWDSAEPARTFDEPVLSVELRDGVLALRVNATMLETASGPIYLDPTWTLSASAGWGSSTFSNAVEDKGDHNIKIGWLADNFNDNTNDLWTIEAGTATFASGVMQLQPSTTVRAGSSWSDERFAFKIRFTLSGTAQAYFRYKDANNHYFLDISEPGDSLTLKKKVSGSLSTIATVTGVPIAVGTDYVARIVAAGNAFEIWWQGTQKWTGTDPSPPGSPISGYVKFATNTVANANVDDVRVWNPSTGTMTTPVRNAGSSYKPLQTEIVGTVDAYSQVHIRIRSSPDNVAWGPWTNLKADVASGVFYATPDQDRQMYYQLRLTLTSGVDSTPFVSELTTTEGSPSTTPAATTGFEPWYPYVGGLVNAASGNLWHSRQDLSVRGRGFSIAFTRSYNSLRGSESGPLGSGWTHAFGMKLVVNADSTVTWNDADGSQQTFAPKGTTGGYAPPRGLPLRLVKNGDGSFNLSQADGGSQAYTSAGRLTSIRDKNGNQLTLTYDGNGRLTTVADDSGKSLTLGYDASSRISTVTDPGLSRQVTYTYDGASNLVSVKDPLNYNENYTYASGRMGAIIDPVGKRTGFVYDGSSRATEVWLGLYQGGAVVWQFRQYLIAYTSTTSRTITNARGYATTLWLNNSVGAATGMSGPSIGCSCDNAGNGSSFVWDGEMNRIQAKDGRGYGWTTDYDHRSDLVARTDPGGNVSSSAWSEVNTPAQYVVLLSSQTNFRGFTTTFAYDGKGNLIRTTDAKGGVTQRIYDSMGFLNRTRDARGYDTWFEYNVNRYLTKVTSPLNQATQYGYDAAGRQTSVTTPLGSVTSTTYNADDWTTRVTNPLGSYTGYEYNGRGDPTKVTDPNGNATRYTVNVTNRKVQVALDARGNSTTNSYDFRGNLVSFRDAKNHVTAYQYDAYDRLVEVSSPMGFHTDTTYDAAGNPIRRLDANGNATSYAYDRLNRVSRINYPAGSVVTYAYDSDGNPTSEAGLGYTTTTTYDALDRAASVVMNYGSFSKTTTYWYDANGNRIAMQQDAETRGLVLRPNGNGGTVQWSPSGCAANYQCVNEATSDGDGTKVIAATPGYVDLYAFADLSADPPPILSLTLTVVAKVPTPCEDITCWGYIRLRVNGYESPALPVGNSYEASTYTWSTNPATGLPWTAADVNALQAGMKLDSTNWFVRATQVYVTLTVPGTNYSFDAAGRPARVTDADGRATTFAYDKDSRRTSTAYANAVWTNLSYDKAGRARTVYTNKSGGQVLESFVYTYDRNGNALTKREGAATTTFAYDEMNRLVTEVTASGLTTTYTYDAVGNRVIKRAGSSEMTYLYDADDRLTNILYGSFTLTYVYDANGNRIQYWDEFADLTRYEYDAENRLTKAVYPMGETRTYTYAASGERMSDVRPGLSTTYYGYDVYGAGGYEDVTAEYDAAGARQARYTRGPGVDEPVGVLRGGAYYAYQRDALGSVTRLTDATQGAAKTYRYDAWGRTTTETGTLANPFQFTGRERDSGGSLYYVRARTYDPDVGGFTSKDPWGGGYAYAGGNPTRFVDPSGRTYTSAYCDSWAVAAGLCIPSNGAPDATVSTSSGGGGGGGGTGLAQDLKCALGWTMFGAQVFFALIGLQVEGPKLAEIAYYAFTDFQWSAALTGMGLQGAIEFILSVGWWLFANLILPHLLDYIPWWWIPAFIAANTPAGWGVKIIELGVSIGMGWYFLKSNGC